jgi:hypothetical protein
LDYSDREYLVSQIGHGSTFIEYEECTYIFREPNSILRFEYFNIRKQEEKNCEKDGFLTKAQEEDLLKEHGFWIEDSEKKLKDLREDLRKLDAGKAKNRFKSTELRRIERTKNTIKNEMEKINKTTKVFFDQTAKYQGDIRAKHWMLQKCLYKDLENRIWESWESFENETNIKRINDLLALTFYNNNFAESDIRELARTEPWRSTWRAACKTGTPLFSVPTSEFTGNQKHLVYWSMVYDNVFESSECPSSSIVEDDEKLDLWFEEQDIKSQNQRKGNGSDPESLISNKKIANASQIFVPVDTVEDAKNVYNELNSPMARSTFMKREKAIQEKGKIDEANMPDTKQEIVMAYNRAASSKITKK